MLFRFYSLSVPSELATKFRALCSRHCSKISRNSSAAQNECMDMSAFPPSCIRNFCITAHIDHGKTTLSSKLLIMSGVLQESRMNELYLDKLRVEKERGITIKAQTASMIYRHLNKTYLLNLIDTPGHVDFSYEVSRSMAACEGALLLVDSVKGIQAQTIANLWLSQQNNLHIVPCINKMDLKTAQPEKISKELQNLLGCNSDEILRFSAATGNGVDAVFPAIIENIPAPEETLNAPYRALLIDSFYQDIFTGVICLVKVCDGSVKVGDSITAASSGISYQVAEVGIMHPEQIVTNGLFCGQVGYIKMGMKSTSESRVGDTFYQTLHPVEPLPGYKPAKPMVYACIYPDVSSDFESLKDSIKKISLTDASVSFQQDLNDMLGMGYRCGFLGLLHMEVFMQRLREEYNINTILTSPNVSYQVTLKDGQELQITQPSQYPGKENVKCIKEPVVKASIFLPKEYFGSITNMCIERRGVQLELEWIDEFRIHLIYKMPLSEVIFDFFDKLKQISSGYATFDYEEAGHEESDIVKLSILLNGQVAEPLSLLVHRVRAEYIAKKLTEKLKETIPRQIFEIRIQASIGSKIIARETVKPFRKDVTAKCYGGDITRKRKLLEKQKEGKKRMRSVGNVSLPPEAFIAVTKIH